MGDMPGLIVCTVIGLVLLWVVVRRPGARIRANALVANGLLRHRQGRYAEAERAYRLAMAIRERIHGPDHATVAIILNNLALTLHSLARLDEAEPMFGRSLEILKGASARQQANLARTLGNLGRLYRGPGPLRRGRVLPSALPVDPGSHPPAGPSGPGARPGQPGRDRGPSGPV